MCLLWAYRAYRAILCTSLMCRKIDHIHTSNASHTNQTYRIRISVISRAFYSPARFCLVCVCIVYCVFRLCEPHESYDANTESQIVCARDIWVVFLSDQLQKSLSGGERGHTQKPTPLPSPFRGCMMRTRSVHDTTDNGVDQQSGRRCNTIVQYLFNSRIHLIKCISFWIVFFSFSLSRAVFMGSC